MPSTHVPCAVFLLLLQCNFSSPLLQRDAFFVMGSKGVPPPPPGFEVCSESKNLCLKVFIVGAVWVSLQSGLTNGKSGSSSWGTLEEELSAVAAQKRAQ